MDYKPLNQSHIQTSRQAVFLEYNDNFCNSKQFQKYFDKWTSGNKDIDKLIQDSQISSTENDFLEWISYNKFTNIKYIAKGGFAKVYSATWIDGRLGSIYLKRDESKRIALKVLNNSKNISEDFLNEAGEKNKNLREFFFI